MINFGIDPHKSSLTAVAIDSAGTKLSIRRFVVNAGTAAALTKWSQSWPSRRFAVEGARGLGRGIAQVLVAGDEDVVDVPSTLAMKVRVISTGGSRKTDPDNAYAVAISALHHKGLHAVRHEDQTTILRLLSERRDDLAHERARTLNRLHQLLRELTPGGVPLGLSADKAVAALRRIKPTRSRRPRRLLGHSPRTDGRADVSSQGRRPGRSAGGALAATIHRVTHLRIRQPARLHQSEAHRG